MSDVDNKVKMIVEGLLLAAGRPLSLDNISQVFSTDERPDKAELKAVMAAISEDCNDRGFELVEVASGFRFQVRQDLGEWVAKLWEEKPPRYTRALLETLALIAYRQPITRGDIEEIRGVTVSSTIIRTLIDREWIRVVGHRDVPGRPAMFATTRQFLDYFNLKSLQDLPPLSEITDLDKSDQRIDLAEDLAKQRIIDLPESESHEEEMSEEERAALLAEEEAIELSKKPLDEILNFGMAEGDDRDIDPDETTGADTDDTDTEPSRSLAQVIPIKPNINSRAQPGPRSTDGGAGDMYGPDGPEDEQNSETVFLEEDESNRDFADPDDNGAGTDSDRGAEHRD